MNSSQAPQQPPVSSAQPGAHTVRMQLHYCDFCQETTPHSRQPEQTEPVSTDFSSAALSDGELLRCSRCEAYTLI